MPVKAGQPIGFVSDTSMLHFETYVKGNTRSRRWFKDERKPPPQLLNPTKYLLFLREHGLVGKSVQAALRGELHALENPWRGEFSLSGRLQEEKWERPFSEGEEVDWLRSCRCPTRRSWISFSGSYSRARGRVSRKWARSSASSPSR